MKKIIDIESIVFKLAPYKHSLGNLYKIQDLYELVKSTYHPYKIFCEYPWSFTIYYFDVKIYELCEYDLNIQLVKEKHAVNAGYGTNDKDRLRHLDNLGRYCHKYVLNEKPFINSDELIEYMDYLFEVPDIKEQIERSFGRHYINGYTFSKDKLYFELFVEREEA